jgi:hypothetical protein
MHHIAFCYDASKTHEVGHELGRRKPIFALSIDCIRTPSLLTATLTTPRTARESWPIESWPGYGE